MHPYRRHPVSSQVDVHTWRGDVEAMLNRTIGTDQTRKMPKPPGTTKRRRQDWYMPSPLQHVHYSTRCRHCPPHLGPFLHLVKAPHDHLALGRLANVFRGVFERVGEEGEPCGAFDGVDW